MKLIITRHGSNWGGLLGSAVADLDTGKIYYIKTIITSIKGIEEVLKIYEDAEGKSIKEELEKVYKECGELGLMQSETDYEIDLELLKNELNKDLSKDEERFFAFDSQEDYIVLENNDKLELIYAEDDSIKISLKNKTADNMVQTMLKLVR